MTHISIDNLEALKLLYRRSVILQTLTNRRNAMFTVLVKLQFMERGGVVVERRTPWFDPHRRHRVVSLSKTH